jgi:Condensation domain
VKPESRENYHQEEVELSPEQSNNLQAFAIRNGLMFDTLILAGWALLLASYNQSQDVVFGATMTGRSAPLSGIGSMIGMFINTLPLRVQITPDLSLITWLKKIQSEKEEVSHYEYSQLTLVQKWSGISKGRPLFDSVVVFDDCPLDTAVGPNNKDSNTGQRVNYSEPLYYPLTLIVTRGVKLSFYIAGNSYYFDPSGVKKVLQYFIFTLLDLAKNNDINVRCCEAIFNNAEREGKLLAATEFELSRELT